MPRYIDADLIPYVESENGVLDDFAYRYDINEIPTADVVPKSEVEKLYKEIDRLSQVVLYHDSFKADEIKDARQEVAREIFKDIKCSILAMSTLALFSYTDNLEESNAKQKCYKYVSELIDELKKKYTEVNV